MADEHKSFVIYESWATLLAGLSEEDAGEIIKYICSQKVGREYEVKSQTARAVLDMITPQLEKDNQKYIEKVERLNRNKNKSEKKKSDISAEIRHDISVKSDSVSESDSVSVSDTPNGVTKISAKADIRGTVVPREQIREVVEAWNELPEPVPKVRDMVDNSPRCKQLKARIKEYGIDNVLSAVKSIKDSPFLLGQKTDFIIRFEWFVGPKNFPKVLDGAYIDRPQSARSGTPEQENSTDYLLRRIAEEEAKEAAG